MKGHFNDLFYKFNFFAGLVKYIEFYAQSVKSLWCKHEDFKLGPKHKPKPLNNHLFKNHPSKKRDESLDCGKNVIIPLCTDYCILKLLKSSYNRFSVGSFVLACGIRNDPNYPRSSNSSNGRIAGGVEAIPYEFPFLTRMVLAFESDKGKVNYFVCGGSIINDRTILTA